MSSEDEVLCTAGSGGGDGQDDDGNILKTCESTYQVAGNQVVLLTRKLPPTNPEKQPGPSVITILASGALPTFDDDGYVDIRGAKGVRITGGGLPIPTLSPEVSSKETNGVEIQVATTQSVKIERLLPTGNQTITMDQSGIMLDAGLTGTISLRAGLSGIDIGPTSITMQSLTIKLN